MCLILLANRAHPDFDLLLAGNRDEFHARPSTAPGVFDRNPVIHAGRDLEAGGTWMGRNAAGLVAALTNRRDPTGHVPPNALSRGRIVHELLRRETPGAALEWIAAEDPHRYRPFNVVFGTAGEIYYFGSPDSGSAHPGAVPPAPPRLLEAGYFALSNSTLDDLSWPKVARSLRFFEKNRHLDGECLLIALQAFLCDPTPPDALAAVDRQEEIHGALGAVFIRTHDYGTVSASIITQGGNLGERYYYADAEDMRSAQNGWALGLSGNGPAGLPPSGAGSPFRLLDFEA